MDGISYKASNGLTGDAGSPSDHIVECPGVFIEVAHKLHLLAFFGKARIVDQLRALEAHTKHKFQ